MTDHTPHTTAEAVQYWYDADVERREERDRLRAVVARIRQMADHWEQQLPEVIRTPAVVSAIRAALEPAVPAGQAEAELRRLGDKTQPTETRPPMDDAQAAAAIAPLEAAVRRHREKQRTEHHIAVLLEAADDLATVFGDPMVKHIGALGASHLRHRAREIEARRLAAEPPEPPVHGESVAALAGYTTDGRDQWEGCPTPESHNWGCGCPTDQLPLHAQSGVDTPGCDCGHDGMGPKWHEKACAWMATLTVPHPDDVPAVVEPAEAADTDRLLHACVDFDTWFDRNVCADPCGAMHTRCTNCGAALDGCPAEPAAGAQQPKETPTVAYSGKGRVWCLACPRPEGEDVPITVDVLAPYEECAGCRRVVVEVAAAREGAAS